MSEELQQKNLLNGGLQVGTYEFYNIGATHLNDLKRHKIIPDLDYGEYSSRKPDALLVDRRNKANIEVIAVIEYKKSAKFSSDKDKLSATQQCNTLAQVLKAKMGIVTDTADFAWINPVQLEERNNYIDSLGKERSYSFIKDEQKQKLVRPFAFTNTHNITKLDELNDETRETVLLIEKICRSIDSTNSAIVPDKMNDPTNLAKQIWQDVWSVSGATPENCLYTFVELFIFKYLSDLGVLTVNESGNQVNFDYIYGLGEKHAFINYTNNVRPYLKELFEPEKPIAQGGTTIINGTVLTGGVDGHDTVFFKILTRFKDFGQLKNIDPNFKSNLFEKFLKESISKKNWGQFFTPRKVIKPIVEMAGLEDLSVGSKICDPFCGVGGFVLEPLLLPQRKGDYYVNNGQIEQKNYYYGYDKGFLQEEQKTIILAKANMLIFLSDLLAKNKNIAGKFAKIWNEAFHLRTKSILGTLDMMSGDQDYNGPYDLILTNPPYVTSGSSNLKDAIKAKGLDTFYKVNGLGVESLALEWVIKNLKKGGRAFVVIPDGILNRQNDSKMRQFIMDECFIDCIISLPINTFFTTPKKTYILGITRKHEKQDKQEYPVFTYLVSNIGETLDVYRFNIEENDLETAKSLFKMYKVNRSFVPEDPRCKIQTVDKFKDELKNHWSVDRWWTREEKIELGIEEEAETVSLDEFIEELGEYHNEFGRLVSESKEVLKKNFKKSVNYKEVSLDDDSLFNLFIGKRVLRKDLFAWQNKPEAVIPLYSANVLKPFGNAIESNIKDFTKPRILWGIDGNFDIRVMEAGSPYATTDHCGAIELLVDNIDPSYLTHTLEAKKHEYGLDRSLRASLENVKKMKFNIPIKEDGSFDIEAQRMLAKNLDSIGSLQKKLGGLSETINEKQVIIDDVANFVRVPITTLFEVGRGKSKYTKGYGNANKGEYSVYSASNNLPLTFVDSFDYYGRYLSWATNGFGGYMKVLNGKFSFNADRGLLVPRFNSIDIDYVKWVLEPQLRGLAKGRLGDRGKNEFTKVYPSMVESITIPIPVDTDGEYDLVKQQEVALMYATVEQFKSKLTTDLERLESLVVEAGS
jgi:type I restriction enzyme M protein